MALDTNLTPEVVNSYNTYRVNGEDMLADVSALI